MPHAPSGAPERRLVARYRYNVFGERIAKVVFDSNVQDRTTYHFYDGLDLSAEADQAGHRFLSDSGQVR